MKDTRFKFVQGADPDQRTVVFEGVPIGKLYRRGGVWSHIQGWGWGRPAMQQAALPLVRAYLRRIHHE